LALVVAAVLALAACNGMFGSSSSTSSAPSQSGGYNSSRDSGALGPGTHDQNRD
jgi:hypothetical protein